MEKKIVQTLIKLFAVFYAGINLVNFGLESKMHSSLSNYSSIFLGALLIFATFAYCIMKCVITYLALTSKEG